MPAPQIKEYKTLGALLKDKKQQEYYPSLVKRLETNDIEIPHLSRKIYYDEIMQIDRMSKELGSTWAESVGGPRSTQKKTKPVLTAEVPAGGFNYDERDALAQMLKDSGPEIPAAFANNFEGLTDIEARKAFHREMAVGARVADNKSDPDLDTWLADAAKKLGVPKPRLIVMESDIPASFVFTPPKVPGSIFISDDMLRIMSPSQVKAVLGHEMDHYKDHVDQERKKQKRGVSAIIKDAIWDVFSNPEELPYKKEYKADLRGDELAGMGEMEQALLRLHFRNEELAHFSDKVRTAFKEENVNLSDAPHYLVKLTKFPHAPTIDQTKDPEKYFGKHKDDTHPPLEWRQRNLKKGQSETVGVT